MSETTAVVTKSAKAPKTAKKAAKKSVKKVAKKVASPQRREGLSKPQVRVLTALAKVKHLTRNQLAEKAEIHPTLVGDYAGCQSDEANARPLHAHTLLAQKFVSLNQEEVSGKQVWLYAITASGRQALAKAKAAK